MLNAAGSPAVDNCTFTRNWASGNAGAVVNGSGSPSFTDCTFSKNFSGRYGGAVENAEDSNTVFTNCTFRENWAERIAGALMSYGDSTTLIDCVFDRNRIGTSFAGALYLADESSTLINCAFIGNVASSFGGAIVGKWATLSLINCTFSGNSAAYGGAIELFDDNNATVVNCTFNGNTATAGRALALHDWSGGGPSNFVMGNSILWDGGDEISNENESTITITYSDVQGGWPGGGNINSDPSFVDADGPDDIGGTADDNLRLSIRSPCIDAGQSSAVPIDVTTDLDGNPRFRDDPATMDTGVGWPAVDMGAYEYFADCNGNEVRDSLDINLGTSADCNENFIPDECELAGGTSEDLNGNGVLDECEGPKNRYLSLVPGDTAYPRAYQVTLTASSDFPDSTGVVGWVGEPFEADYYQNVWMARLVDTPVFRDWTGGPQLIHVGDCAVVPVATYEIRWTPDGVVFFDPVVVPTVGRPADKQWGDVVGSFDWSWSCPDGIVNMDDVMAAIQKFKGLPTAPPLAWVDVEPEVPNAFLNFTDIFWIVQGFKGELPYPFADPADCP